MRSWYSPEIHLHLPIQSRGRSRDHIFGNGMGALPVFLDAPALGTMDDAVTHVLAKYREAMKQDMPQASEALMTLAAQLPVKWFISAVRLTNRGQICSLFHSHTGTFLPGRAEFVGAAIAGFRALLCQLGDERARQLVYPSVWLFDTALKPLMQMPAGTGTFETVPEQLEILRLEQ